MNLRSSICLSLLTLAGAILPPTQIAYSQENNSATSKPDSDSKSENWKAMLQSDSLGQWEKTNFGGEADVSIKEGVLRFEAGDPLTGIHSKATGLPKENYEIRWKARRVSGSDFFVGHTFPIGNEFCTLICGGWGGGLVGISSIDGNDASENATTLFSSFKDRKWYEFKVRVDSNHLTVWIDSKETIKVERKGKAFSLRAEVMRSKPVGYCVFQSVVEVKDWEWRSIDPK